MVSARRRRPKPYGGSLNPGAIRASLLILALLFPVLLFRSHRAGGAKAAPKSEAPQTSRASAPAARTVFPLSVIHGGAYSEQELERARRSDEVVAAHYAGFGHKPKFQKLTHEMLAYVSYRRSNQIFWSKTRHRIPEGETVISDGDCMARARCGNRLSATPQSPVGPKEPPEEVLNTPEIPDEPVTYKLVDLPGPMGRPFTFSLPTVFDGSASAEAVSHLSSGPASSYVPPGYFPPGPGGFGGIGPLDSRTGTGTSTSTAATSGLPGPVPTGIPSETAVEPIPEPGAFGYQVLSLALTAAWLVRRYRTRFLRR